MVFQRTEVGSPGEGQDPLQEISKDEAKFKNISVALKSPRNQPQRLQFSSLLFHLGGHGNRTISAVLHERSSDAVPNPPPCVLHPDVELGSSDLRKVRECEKRKGEGSKESAGSQLPSRFRSTAGGVL